jgi:hypothetical protein
VIEGIIVLGVSGFLWALYWSVNAAPEAVFMSGLWLVGSGFAFGVPTGLVYHVLLFRSLRSQGAVPHRWWIRPTSLHHAIPPEYRFRVLAWCYAGASGFFVILIGLPMAATGALRLG